MLFDASFFDLNAMAQKDWGRLELSLFMMMKWTLCTKSSGLHTEEWNPNKTFETFRLTWIHR